MIMTHFLIALLLAILFTIVLIPLGGHRTRRDEYGAGLAFLFFFLIFLPFIWAGGLWMAPFGPMMQGVAWMPFFLVGLFVMLLMLATLPTKGGPDREREPLSETEHTFDRDEKAFKLFGLTYIVLLLGLVVLIIGSYASMD